MVTAIRESKCLEFYLARALLSLLLAWSHSTVVLGNQPVSGCRAGRTNTKAGPTHHMLCPQILTVVIAFLVRLNEGHANSSDNAKYGTIPQLFYQSSEERAKLQAKLDKAFKVGAISSGFELSHL